MNRQKNIIYSDETAEQYYLGEVWDTRESPGVRVRLFMPIILMAK